MEKARYQHGRTCWQALFSPKKIDLFSFSLEKSTFFRRRLEKKSPNQSIDRSNSRPFEQTKSNAVMNQLIYIEKEKFLLPRQLISNSTWLDFIFSSNKERRKKNLRPPQHWCLFFLSTDYKYHRTLPLKLIRYFWSNPKAMGNKGAKKSNSTELTPKRSWCLRIDRALNHWNVLLFRNRHVEGEHELLGTR